MVGINEELDNPPIGVAEVTLIGTAAGYGESVVIHLGNGEWVVVDCCSKPFSKECLPFEYLTSIGVNVSEQLKCVICTHWHEDHIKGLSTLLSKCSNNTVFAISCAEDRQNFVYEMSSNYRYQGKSRILQELQNTLNCVKEKHIKVKKVSQDQPVFNKGSIICWALSPSETVVNDVNQEIANAMVTYQKVFTQKEKLSEYNKDDILSAQEIENDIWDSFDNILADKLDITSQKCSIDSAVDDLNKFRDVNREILNDRSVALLLTIEGHNVILGADLEVNTNDIDRGWDAVMHCDCMQNVQAHLLKIPHHGSVTGYHQLFLSTHIPKDATSKLTAWNSGKSPDPKPEMLRAYYNHTNNLHITTTETVRNRNTEKDKTIRVAMNKTTEEIIEITPSVGIIRSRLDLKSGGDIWTTRNFGSARQVSQAYLESLGV